MISYTLKGVIDMLMVGRIGTDALAAVGLGALLSWNMIAFPMGVFRGQRPLVSQYLGSGDRTSAFSYGAHAFYLALAFGLLFLVFGSWVSDLLTRLFMDKLNPTAKVYGHDYLQIRMWWALAPMCAMAVGEYLRSIGRPRVTMSADLLIHPINIVLNYALIFGKLGAPEMGVRGAALGTGISEVFGLGLMFWLGRSHGPLPWEAMRLKWKRMKKVLQIGVTGGVQFSIETFSFTLITTLIGHMSTLALAVHNICVSIIHMSMMPAIAVGDGGSVLIGQFMGEKRLDLVEKSLHSTIKILMPFMGVMSILFFFFGDSIVSWYLDADDPEFAEAVALGKWVMIAAAIWQLGDALQIAFRFGLRAAGDHKWVMYIGILCAWLLSVPICWAVIRFWPGATLTHVWLAWSAEIFIGSWIFYRRWKSGGWKTKRLVEDDASSNDLPPTANGASTDDDAPTAESAPQGTDNDPPTAAVLKP